jgi:hypothetical protein
LQAFHQRPGDGAVADVGTAAGAGRHQQYVERGQRPPGGVGVGWGVVLADEGALDGEGAAVAGVFERFPMEGVEGEAAANVEGEVAIAAVSQPFVLGQDVGVGAEKLLEEGFAVGSHGGGRPTSPDLAGEGEGEPLLEVPAQLFLPPPG